MDLRLNLLRSSHTFKLSMDCSTEETDSGSVMKAPNGHFRDVKQIANITFKSATQHG
jgi:hypothetical protein